jgi:putative ABC transport system permease protein
MTIAPATRALTRLAWRELRRRSRRTVLVIALVALPVAALTVGAVSVASSTASQDGRRNLMGAADALVVLTASAGTAAHVVHDLPAGSRVLSVHERSATVPGVRGNDVVLQLTDLPLHDPLTAGMTKLVRGRAPAGPGEVAATPNVLRDLGLRVGDVLVSNRLGLRARITAQILEPTDEASYRVTTGGPLPATAAASAKTRLLVSWPPGTPGSAAEQLRGPGRDVITAADCCSLEVGNDGRAIAREAILGLSAFALLVMGFVIAAAFAIGARRQWRTIGLLRAAAGADDRHIRRLGALQGALCGGAGVIAGLAGGFAVVAALGNSLADRVTGTVSVPFDQLALIAAMAIVASAIGAWLPGRSAARMPVLAALGGRGALRPVARGLPLRGLATAALGTTLLAVAMSAGSVGAGVIGGVLIVLGFALCAPALVAVLEPLAARAGATTRLAARDVVRHRSRSGPLLAAILAVASLALVGAAVLTADHGRSGDPNDVGIGRDQILLSASAPPAAAPGGSIHVPAALRARVRGLLAGATDAELGIDARAVDAKGAGASTILQPAQPEMRPGGGSGPRSSDVAIGGPRLLSVLDAAAGRTALGRGAAVVLQPGLIEGGQIRIEVPLAGGGTRDARVPAVAVRPDRPRRQLFVAVVMSPQAAARIGLHATVGAVVVRAPRALTAAERHAVQSEAIAVDRAASPTAGVQIRVAGRPTPDETSASLANLLAIAAALTLAVVATGLALSAAEGQADDTMLAALGADPGTRRRLRATQAGMLVGLGGALALPAGLIPAAVIILNSHQSDGEALRFAVPWPAVAVVILALPCAAAAGAWLLSRPARWAPAATWLD